MVDNNILISILNAREERVKERGKLLVKYGLPVITLSLNIPGPVKDDDNYKPVFDTGWNLLIRKLTEANFEIFYRKSQKTVLGYEGFITVNGKPEHLKELTLITEEEHPLGRLFDIDVVDITDKKVSREDLGYSPRLCIVCQSKPAFECIVSKSHTLKDTLNIIRQMINENKIL